MYRSNRIVRRLCHRPVRPSKLAGAVREALTDVVKHADATLASVRVIGDETEPISKSSSSTMAKVSTPHVFRRSSTACAARSRPERPRSAGFAGVNKRSAQAQAQLLIEQVTGRSFAEMRRLILRPPGLSGTRGNGRLTEISEPHIHAYCRYEDNGPKKAADVTRLNSPGFPPAEGHRPGGPCHDVARQAVAVAGRAGTRR
ncbi:hypothetical protein ILP97_41820 [Amycolatopsis sp. H6(2020)]|nr:hypothetical protein [Amycolatopsis sp. H6(2020)]